MSRVLLGWEMGSNLGHLSRLLPLARRLKAHGHGVLVVVRDLTLAARMLGPAGIPFIQAPQMTLAPKMTGQPASYADLLRYSGWGEISQLWGMVQAWANVLKLFAPDVAVLDHSPTALLAARFTTTPCMLIGTGFEIPPDKQPLPAFPGFPGATRENAARADAEVLDTANRVLDALRVPRMTALRSLFEVERRWLTTFAELDHYGARIGEQYVGPIGEVDNGERVEWPRGGGHRVFAYLRPDTPDVALVLRALAGSNAAVVCYGPGLASELLAPLVGPRFIVSSRHVEIRNLLREADLCVSYAPAGTVTESLLRGVPQLLAPAHVEAQLTAHRVECMGAGLTLRGPQTEQKVASTLQRIMNAAAFKGRAAMFAARYRGFDGRKVADDIVIDIESRLSRSP